MSNKIQKKIAHVQINSLAGKSYAFEMKNIF